MFQLHCMRAKESILDNYYTYLTSFVKTIKTTICFIVNLIQPVKKDVQQIKDCLKNKYTTAQERLLKTL